jgi:hypothetical protein
VITGAEPLSAAASITIAQGKKKKHDAREREVHHSSPDFMVLHLFWSRASGCD